MVSEERSAGASPEGPVGLRGRLVAGRSRDALGEGPVQLWTRRGGQSTRGRRIRLREPHGRGPWCFREQASASRGARHGLLHGDGDTEGPAQGDGRVLGLPAHRVAVRVDARCADEHPVDVIEAPAHDAVARVAQVERVAELVQHRAESRREAAAVRAPVIAVVH